MYHDGVVNPHPPVTRALNETVQSLTQAGHEIVTWDPSLHRELIDTLNQLYFLDGGEEYHEVMRAGHEPACPMIKWILEKPEIKLTTSSASWKVGSHNGQYIKMIVTNRTKLNHRRLALQTAYAKQWNEAKIDVLLCPANPSVASAHRESTYWGYSSVFNVLDYSGVTFPVSVVKDTDTWENFPRPAPQMMSVEDGIYQKYYGNGIEGPKKYHDAPIPLQLVGRRFTEEKLVSILGRVVKDIGVDCASDQVAVKSLL